MPPKFSLQAVLDVRHSRVEALEIELSELLMAQREGEAMLASLKEAQANLFQLLLEQQSGDIDLFAVAHLRADLVQTQEKIAQVLEALKVLAGRIDAKRQEMVIAKQAEETLGTLKRKEIDRFNSEQAVRESRAQDDIYIAKAFRQSR
jgi:flagellar export protein FliJ